jgi:Zn-dependent metalloprotease
MRYLLIMMACLPMLLFGQTSPPDNMIMNFQNRTILFNSKASNALTPSSFSLNTMLTQLGWSISSNDSWSLASESQSGQTSMLEKTYQQYYKNLPVDGANFRVHFEENKLKILNGRMVPGLNLTSTPAITEATALAAALNYVGANEYAWEPVVMNGVTYEPTQDTIILDSIIVDGWVVVDSLGDTIVMNDSLYRSIQVTGYPTGVLCYAKGDLINPMSATNTKLCYRFTIIAREPEVQYLIYIDAANGNLINKANLSDDGTGNTNYNGSQSFNTKWTGSLPTNRWILHDQTRNIHTWEVSEGNEVRDYDDSWTSSSDKRHVSAHWVITKSFDYFNTKHNHTGLKDWSLGAELIKVISRDYNECGARFDRTDERIETGNNVDDCTDEPNSLDALGHEYAHGIMFHNFTGFSNDLESKSLNESFADIFGTSVEYYVTGSTDWIMFDEWLGNSSYIRRLDNPNATGGYGLTSGCPSYYQQPGYWVSTTTNTVYGHNNAGVQNHWFYLLANGGWAPTGSPGAGTYVTGIGIEKAARIAFVNLIDFMDPHSTYNDARNGSIFAAISLYGQCSNEALQTAKAWTAVGVNGLTGALDVVTNCSNIPSTNPYNALRNLESSCNISAVGVHVDFLAGTEVILKPGFNSNSDFKAAISPCLDALTKSATMDENYAGEGADPIGPQMQKFPEYTPPGILISPNPTTGIIRVLGTSGTDDILNIEIYNSTGQFIANLNPDLVNELNLSSFGPGLYLIIVNDGKSRTTHKVIVN